MTILNAVALARDWALREEALLPGYLGAYLGGSAAALPENAPLPQGSDVDTFVVFQDAIPPKRGKFTHQGVLLEISYISATESLMAGRALADYHLAHSLRFARILDDPTGMLDALHREVTQSFARPFAMALRRDGALSRVEKGLTGPLPENLPDRTLGWLFPTGILTHAVLVAALKNPTVRLRYLKAREALRDANRMDIYEELLDVSGFRNVSSQIARSLLDRLAPIYDHAAAVGRTPFFFSSDVSAQCRPTAIDSMQALIDAGDHRESLFWILATYARAMKILAADDPRGYERHLPDFRAALDAVGRDSPAAIEAARRRALCYIPKLKAVTDEIIARHAQT